MVHQRSLTKTQHNTTELYDDATLMLRLIPDMISTVQEGLYDYNRKLLIDTKLENLLAGIACLCEQAQGALPAISIKDLENVQKLHPN